MKTLLKNIILNGKIQNILIRDREIAYLGENEPDYDKVIDAKGLHLLPGLIDPHVHVRDLGQTEKEDWTSASKAALRGGVTTVFDMPNNKPPTINFPNLELKREKARKSLVNYRFNIALTNYNYPEIKDIVEKKPEDVTALKLFLAGSSANEYVSNTDVIKRFFELSQKHDIPVICHTEMQSCIDHYARKYPSPTVFDHDMIRHRICSVEGTRLLIDIAKETGGIFYAAHTSTAEEIEMIGENKERCKVYCEITPHHLLLNGEIFATAGNFAKVNPPIRTAEDNRALWEGIRSGVVDTLGTDHAPHRRAEKLQDYRNAPSGFPGLETMLPLLLNEVNKGRLDMETLARLTSTQAAAIFGLEKRGRIREGYIADLTLVDMDKEWKIEPGRFFTKAKYSPYEGMTGKGDVVMTIVEGKVYEINENSIKSM